MIGNCGNYTAKITLNSILNFIGEASSKKKPPIKAKNEANSNMKTDDVKQVMQELGNIKSTKKKAMKITSV